MLRRLFWDHDFKALRWEQDRDLIIARILASGNWSSVKWLRERLGNEALRGWLEQRRGAGLSPRHLRFWEVILELPRRRVNTWLAAPGRAVWDRRRSP